MKYFYTYLIIPTNKKSSMYGKVYFGKHITNNLNDNYIGSGIKIQRYLKKFPNDYYREIIKYYNTKEELNKAEYELIKPHLGKNYCLNLRQGGEGGSAIGHKVNKITREKIRQANKGRKFTAEQRYSFGNGNRGKPNTPEQKLKISNKLKGKKSPIKGKHKVWDNKELNIFHFE